MKHAHLESKRVNEIQYPMNSKWKIMFRVFLMGLNKNQLSLLVFCFLQFLLGSIAPLIHGKIINAIINKLEISFLDQLVVGFLSLKVFNYVVTQIKFYFTPGWNDESEVLKHNFYAKIIDKDTEFFDYEKPTMIIKAYNDDFWGFRYFEIMEFIDYFIRNLLGLLFTLFSIFFISSTYLYIEIAKIIVQYLLRSHDNKSKSKFYEEQNKIEAKIDNIYREAMMNVKLVKTFSSEDKIINKLNSFLKNKEQTENITSNDFFSDFINLFSEIIKAIQLWSSISLLNTGQLSLGDFTALELLAGNITNCTYSLNNYLTSLMDQCRKVERFLNYMDYKPKLENGKIKQTIRGNIEFKNVDFYYPTKPEVKIFDNFNLKISEGQIVAFVGPSGCGKVK
jgi:ABC-type multidrug transport system fused ATPase/permease subunit